MIAQYVLPLIGGFTNSTSTVPVPQPPPGATIALVRVDHRARFRYASETGLVTHTGVGWCNFTSRARIVQGWSMETGGAQYPGSRASAVVERFGACVPFDGAADWTGASGWNSGYLWRPTHSAWVIPVAALGDTFSVSTRAHSAWDQNITCYGLPPAWDVTGSLLWLNESWWDGEVTVTYR